MLFYNKYNTALMLFALLLFSCAKKVEEVKPNIIIVYMDDLGYGDVGYNGAKKLKTPNMDALAKGGMNFNLSLIHI